MNLIFQTDGYKVDHRRQYPDNTQVVYSNMTPRASRIPGQKHQVFFGLQYFLQKYMVEEAFKFFATPADRVAEQYQRRIDGYLGPNAIDVLEKALDDAKEELQAAFGDHVQVVVTKDGVDVSEYDHD